MKNLLSDKSIRQALKDGRTKDGKTSAADGDGLGLELKAGKAWWRLRYRFGGVEKMLSLGVYPTVSLSMARVERDKARRLLADGIDPSAQRKADKQQAVAHKTTFAELAESWLATKMEQQGKAPRTLERERWLIRVLKGDELTADGQDDGKGAFGHRPVAEITTPEVVAVLDAVAKTGHHETVSRLRSTAKRIFSHGRSRGVCTSNPAADLNDAFTAPKAKPRPALTDPAAVAELLRRIDAYAGKGPLVRCALQLLTLTFVRPGELRQAEWTEFDIENATWRIPAEKMKMRGLVHEVPLARQALALIAEIRKRTGAGRYLFPGERKAPVISENTLTQAIADMGYSTTTEHCAHGFRTTASTLLNFERDREERRVWDQLAVEFRLAHVDGSVRAIYDRDPLWRERVRMMQHWADKLDTLRAGGAEVVPLAARRGVLSS
jgi:integrase